MSFPHPRITGKVRTLSYEGDKFECYEVRTGGRCSLRIWVRRNVATGSMDYRVIKGDGRTHRFSLYEYAYEAPQQWIDRAIERMFDGSYEGAPELDRTLDR